MYKSLLEGDLKRVIADLGFVKPTDTVLYIPENSQFGDYSSNSPLQLAKQNLGKTEQSSLEIANAILEKLGHPHYLERAEVAGPGFLNFFLSEKALVKELLEPLKKKKETGKRIIVEYADPNTHKEFHIGHLRTLTVGESIARLLEFEGNEIFRINYGSDIGPTVAKALWGVKKLDEKYQAVKNSSLKDKVKFLGEAYAYAHKAYETRDEAKKEIDAFNQKIYERDPSITQIWDETKEWSLAYFDSLFSRAGVEFDRRVNESEIDEEGKKITLEQIGKVFEEDDGAVIFRGENYGLHTRVFINSRGYPSYEAKEMGLIKKYEEIFPFDKLIILSDHQQASFHQVVQKAIELVNPHLLGKRHHLSYGFVSLTTGKMSSREGNVVTAEDLIDQVKEAIKKSFEGKMNLEDLQIEKIAIGAIKFSYLKYSVVSDITFDIEKSISLHGDSGPYLQYVYARINSLLNRAKDSEPNSRPSEHNKEKIAQQGLKEEEREVLRLLEFFDFYSEKSAIEFKPNELCTYLLNLAKSYNLFYEKHSVLGSPEEEFRLALSKKVAETIKLGLYLLGIETLERM
jgi:arginyl-tRNA synthetase